MTYAPQDIEDLVQRQLNSHNIPAGPPPIPSDLSTPWVMPTRTGGTRDGIVYDRHSVSVDCWSDSWAGAQLLASQALDAVMRMEDDGLAYSVEVNALPYNNPDPRHESLPRATFAVVIGARIADRN